MHSTDFHARHEGLLDPALLGKKRVLIVGCGSVGSYLALLLARSGVGTLALRDHDHVSVTNLCRTTYAERDVGRPKVDALREQLRAVRGDLEVDARPVDLRDVDDDEVRTWIDESDLLIAVTDHPPTQARLAALSYHQVPGVFAGVYERGMGGEVIWTAPEETPCYSCVLGAIRDSAAPSRGQSDYGIATGQLASEPALGTDILHVTVCAAKIALALLLRGSDAPAAQVLDPSRSVLFVGNTTGWIWREPLETVWARATRRERCICRLLPGGSTADLITEP